METVQTEDQMDIPLTVQTDNTVDQMDIPLTAQTVGQMDIPLTAQTVDQMDIQLTTPALGQCPAYECRFHGAGHLLHNSPSTPLERGHSGSP